MNNEMPKKLPPRSVEAEQCLLGCLMLDAQAIVKVVDFLRPEDFYKAGHQQIFQAAVDLFEKQEPIDLLSVTTRLKEKNQLEQIGGAGYLSECINSVPTASNVLNYAKIVRKKKVLRDLIQASQEIGSLAYDEAEDINVLLDKAESRIFGVTQKSLTQDFVPVKDTLGEAYERMEKLSSRVGIRGVSTGFSALDNILAGLQKSDLIILASRPTFGKCVTGDTEIVNPNPGSISTIEEIVERKNGNILTLNNRFKITQTKVADFMDNGEKPVFQVKTALGKEIEATINHPFLTINGWTPLEELKVGDRIAVPRRIPIFGNIELPAHKVKSLAYFIAEGGLTKRTPVFTSTNKAIVKDFLQSVLAFPRIKANINKSRSEKKKIVYIISVSEDAKNYKIRVKNFSKKIKSLFKKSGMSQVNLAEKSNLSPAAISVILNGHCLPSNKNFLKILDALKLTNKKEKALIQRYNGIRPKNNITDWLKSLELMGKLSKEKVLPKIVFSFDKKTLSLFLNRLFACDGSFWQNKEGSYHLSYASSSKKLIKQVQHLLLRFGVISTLRKKKIKYKKGIKLSFELEAHSAKDLLAFVNEIGIYGEEKKLAEAKKRLSKTRATWCQDTLPIEIWKKIMEIKGEKSWYSLYPKLGLPKTHNIHAFRRHPRRETIAKLAKVLRSRQLRDLSQGDIYWDRIVRISYRGIKRVYDLTIPNHHNFVANDFFVHNSSLALNIATHAAIHDKATVGIFSLEMSKDQLVDRLISSQAGVDMWRLRTGRLSSEGNENDYIRIRKALDVLSTAPIYIDDAASSNILQMKAMARRLQAKEGLGLIVVDYLQLMESRSPSISMVQQMTEISRSLKALARELDVPVLALSQLSRAVERRSPSIPRLADLRETGALEQDSDVVLFIYREDRYRPDTPRKNIADIIIAKHRNGPVGKTELYFDEKTVTFRGIERTTEE